MGRSKIERLGMNAEKLVFQARSEGKSFRDIADEIEQVFNEDISHQAVKNYYENHSDRRARIMGEQAAQQIAEQELGELIDVKEQLKEMNDELKDIRENLDKTDRQDVGLILKTMKEARKQLKFQKDAIEQVTQPDTQVTNVEINQTDVMMEFNQYLNELEEQGAFECENCGHKHVKLDPQKV